ncbi:MAG TPA: acyltransferase [Rhizobium sp.]|nr:acyltransferase [Rhizobium sp.]
MDIRSLLMNRDQYLPSLDGLRGIAAFAVVLSHIGLLLGTDIPWLNIGDESVALFFALSGFLMAHLYGDKPFTFARVSDYLVHRFTRIYPVYLVAICFVILLSMVPGLDYFQPITGAVQILRHVAMLGSSGVFWSIPPEIQFYLFFLLLWLCFEKPGQRQTLAVALLAAFTLGMVLDFPGPGILLLSKIPYFLFGAFAGRLFRSGLFLPSNAITGVAALGLLAVFFLGRNLFSSSTTFWGTQTALIAATIVYLSACEALPSKAILAAAPLRFAGKISFSLYLFHVPVSFLVTKALPAPVSPWLAAGAMIAASLIAATASHYGIERPTRRWLLAAWNGRRARHTEPVPADVPAPAQRGPLDLSAVSA